MANQEHLKLLKQGVAIWNQWRQEHQDITPDLFRADFSEADLSAANLERSEFRQADLYRAEQLQKSDEKFSPLRAREERTDEAFGKGY